MVKPTAESAVRPGILPSASQVAIAIRRMIRENDYRVGDRLENERDLAEQFGVSRGTLRQAMEVLERDRIVVRQQGRGTFVANPAYARPSGADTSLIAAMVYDKEGYFSPLLRAASSCSSERGYMLATGSNFNADEEHQHIEAFLQGGVRGVLLATRPEPDCPALGRLREVELPVVLVDTHPAGCEEDFVSVDNRLGLAMAVQHLASLGHRRLAYIGHENPHDIPCQADRVGGYREACLALQIEPVVHLGPLGKGPTSPQGLRAILESPSRPTGIIAFNDEWAVGVIAGARELGLRVPQDLSVVGFDDTMLAQRYDIPLTTINPACEEVGLAATSLLIDKIEKPRPRSSVKILIRPRLVVRNSTGPFTDA